MTMKSLVVPGLFAIVAIIATAQTPSSSPPAKSPSTAPKLPPSPQEGQRLFNQNCSRCHSAPDGFSPRISGTVLRHMRVRASLSKSDEQELLRFFNP